jgi:hypothetical protein
VIDARHAEVGPIGAVAHFLNEPAALRDIGIRGIEDDDAGKQALNESLPIREHGGEERHQRVASSW